jgi:hypothetical protein
LARPLMPSVPKYRRAIPVPSAALGKSPGLSLIYLSYVRSTTDSLTFFRAVEYMINGATGFRQRRFNVGMG